MIPLIYVLQNGKLSGLEQMALATLDGLRDEFKPHLFAGETAVINEANEMGFSAQGFTGVTDLSRKLWLLISANSELVFVATDLSHSYSLIFLNTFYRRKIKHLHIVSGSENDHVNYAKISKLNKFDLTFIALSEHVKAMLIANDTKQDQISVIENFLTRKRKEILPRRLPFKTRGVKKVMVIAPPESIEKVDLLLEALDQKAELSVLDITIYGTGAQFESLKKRVPERNPNVHLAGFDQNISRKLAEADLFLHLCPTQSMGLTILEAMAEGVPVLASDCGGIGKLISHNINGFSFKADDSKHLALRLEELSKAPFNLLNAIAKGGEDFLNRRFSAENGVEKYRRLIWGQKVHTADLTRGKLIL